MNARREEILSKINDCLSDEGAVEIGAESKIIDSGNLDSFGITMVMFALDEEYGCFPQEKDGKAVDFNMITANDLIDTVIEYQDKQNAD